MRFIIKILIIIGLITIMSSCCKEEGWTNDYYSYHMGAFINGREYHEAFSLKKSVFGVTYREQNGFVFITNLESGIAVSRRSKDIYSLDFEIIIDKATFDLMAFPAVFYFSSKNEEDLYRIHNSESSDYLIQTPWVCGRLGKYPLSDNPHYIASEGFINIGQFDSNSHNIDRVTFEFVSVDDKGEIITIKDGFINTYFEQ